MCKVMLGFLGEEFSVEHKGDQLKLAITDDNDVDLFSDNLILHNLFIGTNGNFISGVSFWQEVPRGVINPRRLLSAKVSLSDSR